MIKLANQNGLLVLLDPIETGGWLSTLENNGLTKAFDYGVFLGRRYKSFDNIVWLSGNDFQSWNTSRNDNNLIKQVMVGIASTNTKHLQTIELSAPASYSNQDHATLDSLLRLDAAYTYYETYDVVLQAYNSFPTMPTFLVEANYEYENNTGQAFGSPGILRREAYWTLLSGAGGGYVYGSRYTWTCTWISDYNLDSPGVAQLQYAAALFSSRKWWKLAPDLDHTVVTAGYGVYNGGNVAIGSGSYVTTARASDGSLIISYSPGSTKLSVDMAKLNGKATARWFDPSNGVFSTIPGSPFANSGTQLFTTPGMTADGDRDWVLLLEACTYTLGSTLLQPAASGGASNIHIETDPSCAWAVSGLPNWITVSGASSGTGPANVTLVMAANTGATRSSTVSIAGVSLTVSQAAVCSYAVGPGGQAFAAEGGNGMISITAGSPECAWTVSSAPDWVRITSPASGTGNGAVGYQVVANAGADRIGSITIAGDIFTVEQASISIAGSTNAGSMPQVASAGGWKTTITLINTGSAQATARLNFFDNNGNPLTLPLRFPQSPTQVGPLLASTLDRTLNSGASLAIESGGPANQPSLVGWAQLVDAGNVGGFAVFTESDTLQEAVVPLETRNASSRLLAFDDTDGAVTGLAIANMASQPASIPMIIRNDAGIQIGTQVMRLPSQGHTSLLLTDSYPVTANNRGTIEFGMPPSGPISALGLRANGSTLTTIPVFADVTAGGGSMAQVTSGDGWQTTFTLVNTGTSAAQVQLNFFDNNGSALSLPLTFVQSGNVSTASTVSQTIAAGATLVILTHGSNTGASMVGSAQLTTTGNVGGFAIFRYTPTGQEAVVPLETRNAGAYVLAFDNTNGFATGVALANVSSQPTNVPVVLRDDTGASLGMAAINLAARGHTSFVLTDRYATSAGKRGTVEFYTPRGTQISVLGLRATPTGAVTTIPVLVE
jgi:hypothetical protein